MGVHCSYASEQQTMPESDVMAPEIVRFSTPPGTVPRRPLPRAKSKGFRRRSAHRAKILEQREKENQAQLAESMRKPSIFAGSRTGSFADARVGSRTGSFTDARKSSFATRAMSLDEGGRAGSFASQKHVRRVTFSTTDIIADGTGLRMSPIGEDEELIIEGEEELDKEVPIEKILRVLDDFHDVKHHYEKHWQKQEDDVEEVVLRLSGLAVNQDSCLMNERAYRIMRGY